MGINLTHIFSATLVLLSIIDIIGSVPIILDLRAKGKEVNAFKATIYSTILMVGFYYGGNWILNVLTATSSRLPLPAVSCCF